MRAFLRRLRIRGVAILGFGGSWDLRPSEKELVRKLAICLQGRGCLSVAFDCEYEKLVLESVGAIRARLDETLQELTPGSGAFRAVGSMRDAARVFMNSSPPAIDAAFSYMRPAYRDQLTELRTRFRAALEALDDGLGLPEAAEAAAMIPRKIDAPPFHERQLAPPRSVYIASPEAPPTDERWQAESELRSTSYPTVGPFAADP